MNISEKTQNVGLSLKDYTVQKGREGKDEQGRNGRDQQLIAIRALWLDQCLRPLNQ